MGESGDNSLCGCGGVDRPNWNGQPIHFSDPRATDSHQYFSTNVFFSENPDGNTFGVPGTANRRFFHGPGLNIWDLSLHKTTHVTEKTSLEFRAEFFNIFNHAQFDNPTGNFASGNFGNVTSVRDFPRIGQLGLKFYF